MPEGDAGRFAPAGGADRPRLIAAAYLAGEGGYLLLARRFGTSKSTVARVLGAMGLRPSQLAPPPPPRRLPGVHPHARERCLERHGLDLTDGEWLAVWLDVAEGRSVLVRRHPDRSEIHAVRTPRLGDRPLLVAYKPKAGLIVTTLPDSARRLGRRY